MAVTMKDVADAAGVSIATVSFVINNTKRVAPETRRRIEQTVLDLGYRPNRLARALASQRTKILALAFPVLDHRMAGAIEFVTAASRRASEEDHHLVVWPVGSDGLELSYLVGEQLVDGVLLMEVHLDDPRVDVLRDLDVPFALIGRTRDVADLHSVDIDFDAAIALAVDHLADLGHTRIALATGSESDPGFSTYGPFVRLERAYLDVATRRGMPPVIVRTHQTVESGRAAVAELVAARTGVTGLLVVEEVAAVGELQGLAGLGVTVPGDMSVVGVGGSAGYASLCVPPLTAVLAPGAELGRLGVDALLRRLDDLPASEPVLRTGPLVLRESTGPHRRPAAGGSGDSESFPSSDRLLQEAP